MSQKSTQDLQHEIEKLKKDVLALEDYVHIIHDVLAKANIKLRPFRALSATP